MSKPRVIAAEYRKGWEGKMTEGCVQLQLREMMEDGVLDVRLAL